MLCDYGCGQEATHRIKNGKNVCNKSHSSCPVNKERNRQGLLAAYREGRKKSAWTDEHRQKSASNRRDAALHNVFRTGSTASNSFIRNILINDIGISENCQNCGINEWHGVKISLELDHINGDSTDNRLDNLRLLCPNCHSITPTWRGRNINSGKRKVTDNDLLTALENCSNIRQALLEVGLAPKGGNYARAKKLLRV